MEERILSLAAEIAGCETEDPLLRTLCTAAEAAWRGRLRAGLTAEACGEAFLCAAAFTTAAAWTPDAIVINAYKYVGDGSYLAVSWALGAAWVAVCTLLGLWAMHRKEIH